MNVLLIEDDVITSDTIEQLLKIIDPSINVMGCVRSVKSAMAWFEKNESPELIFTDIELEDGQSFEVFKAINPSCMIVFITSFDTYALKAFKLNSIDYILKPVTKASLEGAVQKFKNLSNILKGEPRYPNMLELIRDIQQERRKHNKYKPRFLVKRGQKLVSIPTEEIAYFYSEEGINYLKTKSDQKFILDYTLDELEEMLHPDLFFRANRSIYVSVASVDHMTPYQGNRLQLGLNPPMEIEAIVSREKVTDFKLWLGK
jgi:two-component system response regulator LytT